MGSKYKDKTTTHGGARGYKMVSSKWYKTADGEPARITSAREEMMDRLGRVLRSDEIVHHVSPGSHRNGEQGSLEVTTRGKNTASSNKLRRNGRLYVLLKMGIERKRNEKDK